MKGSSLWPPPRLTFQTSNTIITISVLSFCPRTISKDLGPWPRSPQPCRRGWHFFIIGKSLSYWKTPIPDGHSLEKLLDDSRRCNSSGGGIPSWAYLQSCFQWNAVTIDVLYCKGSSTVITPWFMGARIFLFLVDSSRQRREFQQLWIQGSNLFWPWLGCWNMALGEFRALSETAWVYYQKWWPAQWISLCSSVAASRWRWILTQQTKMEHLSMTVFQKPKWSTVIMPLWWLILCIDLAGPQYPDTWSNSSQFVAGKVFLAVRNI